MAKKTAPPGSKRFIRAKELSEIAYVMSDIESDINSNAYIDIETGTVVRDLVGGKALDYDTDEDLLDALASKGYDADESDLLLHEEIEKNTGGRYIRIPHVESWQGYQDMKDFVEVVSSIHVREVLEVAIDGAGAFRRFKDVLARFPSWEEQWYAFREAKERFRATEWLESEGFSILPESES